MISEEENELMIALRVNGAKEQEESWSRQQAALEEVMSNGLELSANVFRFLDRFRRDGGPFPRLVYHTDASGALVVHSFVRQRLPAYSFSGFRSMISKRV